MSKHKFKTEVNQLLHLIVHSLYSHKEIFLRELISNASDALDKLKLKALTEEKFKDLDYTPEITVKLDEKNGILSVEDNGIGMDENDLMDNLGTIARSGTRNFLEKLSGDKKKDMSLIGQFGVGFYSSYMVADQVRVLSRKAGDEEAWEWTSDGQGSFSVKKSEKESQGTLVELHLNDEGKEYSDRWQVGEIIRKYSDHIPFPIFLNYLETAGSDKKKKEKWKKEQVNSASALWRTPSKDIKPEQYNEFYKTVFHESADPLHVIHTRAEGTMEYTTLFFIPEQAPFDLYYANYRPGVRLYVKRVFITDDEKELLPTWLRFVRGIIDSEDLPLNVSREILQQNRTMAQIRNASVKKILDEIGKLSTDKEKFGKFYKQFGRPLKEGLAQDPLHKEELLELVRFRSLKKGELISLAEYKEGLQKDQKNIYYITGSRDLNLENSPLLEAYKEKDYDVLMMDDEIDELVIPSVREYKGLELKSVNRSDSAEDLKTEEDTEKAKKVSPLLNRMKSVLKDIVKDIRSSSRLSDSPSCLVADTNDPTFQMQHILKAMGQKGTGEAKPILEINPGHRIITRLQEMPDGEGFEDISWLLYEQALLMEGVRPQNPVNTAKRINRLISRTLPDKT